MAHHAPHCPNHIFITSEVIVCENLKVLQFRIPSFMVHIYVACLSVLNIAWRNISWHGTVLHLGVTLCYHGLPVGMSSIWRGSIHREINDFDVKSICQYAQSMCGGRNMFAKHTFLSGNKLPRKPVNGILTSSTTCYLRYMCLFRSTLFPNMSTK